MACWTPEGSEGLSMNFCHRTCSAADWPWNPLWSSQAENSLVMGRHSGGWKYEGAAALEVTYRKASEFLGTLREKHFPGPTAFGYNRAVWIPSLKFIQFTAELCLLFCLCSLTILKNSWQNYIRIIYVCVHRYTYIYMHFVLVCIDITNDVYLIMSFTVAFLHVCMCVCVWQECLESTHPLNKFGYTMLSVNHNQYDIIQFWKFILFSHL